MAVWVLVDSKEGHTIRKIPPESDHVTEKIHNLRKFSFKKPQIFRKFTFQENSDFEKILILKQNSDFKKFRF